MSGENGAARLLTLERRVSQALAALELVDRDELGLANECQVDYARDILRGFLDDELFRDE